MNLTQSTSLNRKYIRHRSYNENFSHEQDQNKNISDLKNQADFARNYINQVVAICMNKSLLGMENSNLMSEAKEKAEEYLRRINFGAYTCSKGIDSVRKNIAKFITKRDGGVNNSDEDKIFLTYGATDAYQHILGIFEKNDKVINS